MNREIGDVLNRSFGIQPGRQRRVEEFADFTPILRDKCEDKADETRSMIEPETQVSAVRGRFFELRSDHAAA